MNRTSIINSLLAYIILSEPLYSWYRYITNALENSDGFEKLEEILLANPNAQIIVYINTDNEYITFREFKGDQNEISQPAYIYSKDTVTFYIYLD